MPVERRAEGPRNGAREGTGGWRNKRLESRAQQLRSPTRERPGKKRCSRWKPEAARRCQTHANLLTESDVRDVDGTSRGGGKLQPRPASGETQPGSGGSGRDDHGATGFASSSELGDTP